MNYLFEYWTLTSFGLLPLVTLYMAVNLLKISFSIQDLNYKTISNNI